MPQKNNDGLLALLIILGAAVVIVILYLLFKAFLIIGILAAVAGVIIFFAGLYNESGSAASLGAFMTIIGIFVAVIGYEGVSFFEDNPTGQTLLDSSGKIINASAETAGVIADAYKSEAALDTAVQNAIIEGMNNTE